MASEITVNAALNVVKSALKLERRPGAISVTMTGARYNLQVSDIGFAAHEQIPIGDVATAGWAFFRNLDTTNFVTIGVEVAAAFYPLVKLKAGEPAMFRLGTNT
ncbi:MAG: hypothetical protein K8T91_08590, partial [Planctomycetes bacterium]|nr:hypothetical protein [Planctomycetota bacterium]